MTNYPERYREHLLNLGLASRTIAIYEATIDRAAELCDDLRLDLLELDPAGARRLADAWSTSSRSGLSHLRSALQHAWEAAGRFDGPGRAIRVPRKAPGVCRALDGRSAAVLAAAAEARGDHKGLAVLLGLYGALRRAEIAGARWSDLRGGWLHVLGKGDRERDVPVHPVLLAAWRSLELGAEGPWVFPGRFVGRQGRTLPHVTPATVWNWVRDVAGEVGLEVTTHELRHTCLATAHDATGDLRATQAFAGHARPETTVIYTRATGRRLQALVAAIDYREEHPCAS